MAHPLVEAATAKIAELVDECLANDETTVPFGTLLNMSEEMGVNLAVMVGLARNAGLSIGPREVPKAIRGFKANSHDRWSASPCHGGSGWQQINGFAGQKG